MKVVKENGWKGACKFQEEGGRAYASHRAREKWHMEIIKLSVIRCISYPLNKSKESDHVAKSRQKSLTTHQKIFASKLPLIQQNQAC